MITKVCIKNFQSHQDSVMEFHPGVNTLVGSSDSGKSAIFRAIGWVVTNRPLGSAFCRWGTKKTQVDLTIDDEIEIGRTKSKSENNYLFQDRELLAGTEVPEDIQRVLKIDPIINFQHQISAPFLLSSSPGEVAAFFNDIAGLSDIDLSIKNLKSWQAAHVRQIKRLDLDIEKLTGQVVDLEYLDQAEQDIETLEKKDTKLVQLKSDYLKVKDLIHKHSRCSETLDLVKVKAGAVKPINNLLNKAENIGKLRDRGSNLYQTIRKYQTALKRQQTLEKKGQALEPVLSIGNKMYQLSKVRDDMKRLKNKIKTQKDLVSYLKTKQQEAQQLKNRISKMMPQECPLCGQEVK
jgi:DNA repair protein SbcC/Rad50